jgi:type I restriction enzyme S subunit
VNCHWKSITISDIAEVVTKGTTPTSVGFKYVESGVNFVKVETITSSGQFIPSKFAHIDNECHQALRRSQLASGDILFSIAGALGRTARVTPDILPANTNQALSIIRLKRSDDVLPEFILHALSSGMLIEQIERQRGGVAQQNLSLTQVKNFQILLPPIAEQKQIVAILDEAFEGIDSAIANTERNLANARELFESYLQSVFTYKDESWDETTLGKICQFENGDRGKNYPNRSEYVESGIPWINTGHIRPDGTLSESDMNFITREKYDSLRSGKIRPGDLVYCLRGATIGKTAIVDPLTEGAVASSLVIIRPSDLVDSYFLYYFLTSSVGKKLIKLYDNGAAQPNLGAKSVAKYTLALPTLAEQKVIVEKLAAIAEEAQRLEAIYQQKLAALNELKQSILQKAFSGELTAEVGDAAGLGAKEVVAA